MDVHAKERVDRFPLMRVALELFYEEVLQLIQLLSVISSNYNIVDEYSTCGKYVPPCYCSFLYVERSIALRSFVAGGDLYLIQMGVPQHLSLLEAVQRSQ